MVNTSNKRGYDEFKKGQDEIPSAPGSASAPAPTPTPPPPRRGFRVPAGAPWMAVIGDYRRTRYSALHQLSIEIHGFEAYMTSERADHRRREGIIEYMRQLVQYYEPAASVESTGSFMTGLFLPDGDLDLTINLSADALGDRDPNIILENLAAVLENLNIGEVKYIKSATVPILDLTVSWGDYEVDLSLNQATAVETATLINSFIQTEPSAKGLILVMKLFLQQRNMHKPYYGGMSGFLLISLIISFFQMRHRLGPASHEVAGTADDLGSLLLEFLHLYGIRFNFSSVGISLLNGGRYFNIVEKGWVQPPQGCRAHVANPLDETRNIGSSTWRMHHIRQAFAESYDALRKALDIRQRRIHESPHAVWETCLDRFNESSSSLLNHVVGIPTRDVEYRAEKDQAFPLEDLEKLLAKMSLSKST